MKHTILTAIIAAATIFAAAPAADAQRHHRHHHQPTYIFVSGYHHCGTPIYTERYVIRYDRYRRPVYGYRVIRHRPHHVVRPAPRGYRVAPPPRHRRGGGYIRVRF